MKLQQEYQVSTNGVHALDSFQDRFAGLVDQVGNVVVTSRRHIRLALLGLFAQGHVLLEDLPANLGNFGRDGGFHHKAPQEEVGRFVILHKDVRGWEDDRVKKPMRLGFAEELFHDSPVFEDIRVLRA